jgi:serine/threonine protein kinase
LQAKSRLYLVMEYCGGGDLAGYIRQHKKTTEAVARSFIQQLGAGMKEMWLNNFVHVHSPQFFILPITPSGPSVLCATAE